MRLIDADALIENKFKNDISYNAFVSLVKRQPSAQPKLDEWCKDCKEYDQERHCCPRFNRVIRTAIDDAQPEIVRCKDCKHRKFVDFGMGDCLHPSGCRGIAFDNHFCALGERREA